MRNIIFISLLLVFASFNQCAAQLIPDSTFGQNGYFITNYPGLATFTYKIHELDNGDLLAIGTHDGEIRVWKYDPSGQLINSYGTNGIASNPTLDAEPGNMHSLYDYEIYENGKLLILSKLGEHNLNYFDSSKYAIVLTSFNADGSVNNSFNGNGYLVSKPNPLFEYNPYCLLVDKEKNNVFYVGGEAYERGHTSCPMGTGKWFISKYNSSGALDLSFNNTGYRLESATLLSQSASSPQGRLRDMAFMENGSVRAVGAFHNFDKAFFDFALKQNGTFDSTFATNGISIYPVNYNVLHIERGTWAKFLKDTSVLFYTKSWTADSSTYKMVKHKKNGMADTNYGVNGLFTFMQPSTNDGVFMCKSDNSLLFSYYKTYGTNQKIEFMNLLPQGAVNISFGINGLLATQPIALDVYVNASVIFDGTWNKNETTIFLSAAKQPITYSNYGIFKYKWPGLTPLGLTSNNNISLSNIYPNPLQQGQPLFIQTDNDEINNVEWSTLQGTKLPANTTKVSQGLYSILVPFELKPGCYFISFIQNNQKYTKSILIH